MIGIAQIPERPLALGCDCDCRVVDDTMFVSQLCRTLDDIDK